MKVVIVGGGFAGVKAALDLARDARFEVTLISERSSFEYHAALYRSATGRSALEVQIPLHELFEHAPGVEVIPDRAKTIDTEARKVIGEVGTVAEYDALILALGCVTEYYGIKGLSEFSYGIKSIQEALELKQHLHQEMDDPDKLDSHYVVVGGGPTGVELAAELVSYLGRLYRRHKVTRATFQVELVEAAPRLLPTLPESVSKRVERRLHQLGVKVVTGTAVKGETTDQLMLPHGDIKTHTVIWTAGVINNPFFKTNELLFKLTKGNRVEVDDELKAADNIYVVGDSAATAKTGWAQTAVYDADFVTDNLVRQLDHRPLKRYHPHQPIGVIPVGPKWCAVSWRKLQLYGRVGWWIRRLADLRLFMHLLPPPAALKTWLHGNQISETCPVCAQR